MRSLVTSCVVALLGVSASVSAEWVASSSLSFHSIPFRTPSNFLLSAHDQAAHALAARIPAVHLQLNHFINHVSTQLYQHHTNFKTMASSAAPVASSCSDAINELQAKLTSCGLSLAVSSNASTAPTNPTVLASQIQSMCSSGTCASELSALVQNAGVQCAAPPAAYASIQSLLLGLCTQDAQGNYCVPQLLLTSSSLSSINTITNSQLNTICSPCITKVIALFAPASSAATTAAFQFLCVKDPTDSTGSSFCIPKLLPIMSSSATPTSSVSCSSSSSSSSPPTTAEIDALCSPCMRRLLSYALQLSPSSTSSSACPTTPAPVNLMAMIDGMCSFNSNGQRCFEAMVNFVQHADVITATSQACSNVGMFGCSSSCRSAYSNMIAPVGCCWTNLVSIIAAASSAGSSMIQVGNLCQLNVSTCSPSASTPVTLTLILPALSYTWCATNLDICQSNLKVDIANAAFVSQSSVSVNVWPFENGGTKVTVSITANSNADAVAAQNTLNLDLAQGSNFALTQTTAAASSGGGLILSATSSGLITPSGNSTAAKGATPPSNAALAAAQPTHFLFALFVFAAAFNHF